MADNHSLAAPNQYEDHGSWTGRVFLVQLALDADPADGRFRGRVQHMRSSDAAHFETLEELAAFMGFRIADEGEGRAS
jgi:hypothetical protein